MSLLKQITLFDAKVPRLRTQDGSYMMCCWASTLFAERVFGAKLVHLVGHRFPCPNRGDEYPSIDPYFYHVVVEYRGLIIDWTRRHLIPNSVHPFIQTRKQLKAEWIKIGPTPESVGIN